MSTYQQLFGRVLRQRIWWRENDFSPRVVLRPVQTHSFLFPANFRLFQTHTKMTKKALVLLADGAEEMEFTTPGKQWTYQCSMVYI